jgi:carboxyl-terminal processing protease
MIGLALAAIAFLQVAQDARPAGWVLGGTNPSGYVMTATGVATDAEGATLMLRSTTAAPTAFGSINDRTPADTLRARRVRISADIETRDVSTSASVWLRADSGTSMLVIDVGADQRFKGSAGPRHMDVTVFVPSSATHLVFGLLLSGTGEVTARNVRVAARPVTTAIAPDARRELDSAIALVRRHSLWRDTVTWSRVEPDVRAIAAGSETTNDVIPAIRALLLRLGDHHSFLMKPQGADAFRTGGAENARPVIRVQTDGIGYVSVPAYSGADRTAAMTYVRSFQDSLSQVVARGAGACRWIVDLRGNGGGNMWPMLGGLRPFLGDAGLGSFVSAEGSQPLWRARDGFAVEPNATIAPLESAYVAVLTSPRTGSSGEAVEISFIGRPRTRSFGLPTAGLSTSNSSYALPDGSMIFLTTAVEADRLGKRYGEKITPDEVVPAGAPNAISDPQLERAVGWLNSQTCPAR